MPSFRLRGGASMPGIGLGTFGSDKYDGAAVARAVREAVLLGYRLIDCAAVYGNEAQVGEALEAAVKAGDVRRDELFVVSKVWNDHHGPGDVLLSCAQSLKDLRLDYLDLFLVHWPFPNFHPKGAAPDYHDANAKPYVHEAYMATWRQMERLHAAGIVRHIGTSNMTEGKLAGLVRDCTVMPAVNEMEMHPTFQQEDLFQYCIGLGILPVGYCPLGSPSRPDRDRTPEDVVDMESPVILRIAAAHGIHPAQVCLQWAVQRGQVPIPFSVKTEQLVSNLRAVTGEPLTDREMEEMKTVEAACRLIKGQVFLWDGAKDWTELWRGEKT
jgi:alcohol dehydrogenase (NADP+)